MGPPLDPIETDTAIPPRADVVIVGGGIIGTSTALFLARKGISVALCEKGHIGGEQSSRNWGWARAMGRDPREAALALESLRIWRQLNTLTEAETGFRQCGIVYLCRDDADVKKREAWLDEVGRPHQMDSRMLTTAEARRRPPRAIRQLARRAVPRPATAAPSHRRLRPRLQRRPDVRVRRWLPGVRSEASKRREAAFAAWLPRRAGSTAPASCSPAASGHACSAAITAYACRS